MKRLLIIPVLLLSTITIAQLKPKADVKLYSLYDRGLSDEIVDDEESERGFTFAMDLGVYLASKKTANLYNGSGLANINAQSNWLSVEERFTSVGFNQQANIVQEMNTNPALSQYSGTIVGFALNGNPSSEDYSYARDMNYTPSFFFGLNATYHLSDYWGIVGKVSVANLVTTAVYTMELFGPLPPQNASEVIEVFNIRGEEQRVHLDLGFKNTSYNDYGFKWFWGAGASLVGAQIQQNTAFIGETPYDLIFQNNGNQQFLQEFNANQTLYNFGFYANTGWEFEYKERYDVGIGFNLSRDVIELGPVEEIGWNKRIYFYFGI